MIALEIPKVLVVDDDMMNIAVFEALLGAKGYDCDIAAGGKLALALIDARL